MKTITFFRNFVMASFVMSLIPVLAYSEPFTTGNLIVTRLGDGITALSSINSTIYLDEYTTGGTLVQTITLPTVETAVAPNNSIYITGTAIGEGIINLSTDNRYLLVAGYKTLTAAGLQPRVIATIDKSGSINTTTSLAEFSTSAICRGAISTNGTDLWIAAMGGTGVNYTTLGSTTSTPMFATGTNNVKGLGIYDNKIYFCSTVAGYRFAKMDNDLPKTIEQPYTVLANAGSGVTLPIGVASPNSFVMFDLDATIPGVDVMYVAEDCYTTTTTNNAAKGLTKYSLSATGLWVKTGAIIENDGIKGITGTLTPSGVVLYMTTTTKTATSTSTNTRLVTCTDATGYNGTLSGSLTDILVAPALTAFRGVCFAPSVAAPIIPTAVKNVFENKKLVVSQLNGTISFTATSGEKIEIINAVGQKLTSSLAQQGLNSITPSAKGVLMVKVGNRIAKVIL